MFRFWFPKLSMYFCFYVFVYVSVPVTYMLVILILARLLLCYVFFAYVDFFVYWCYLWLLDFVVLVRFACLPLLLLFLFLSLLLLSPSLFSLPQHGA